MPGGQDEDMFRMTFVNKMTMYYGKRSYKLESAGNVIMLGQGKVKQEKIMLHESACVENDLRNILCSNLSVRLQM